MKTSLFFAIILLIPAFVIAAEGGPSLPAQPAPPLSPQATGFYHVESIDGVDWVIDPHGRDMTIRGIDHVRPNGWKDRNLGYDVYGRFVETNYPSREAWVAETLDRLGDWGFNVLANHCDEPLLRGRTMPHTITLYLGGKFGAKATEDPDRWITPWSGPSTGIPNVFHPDFERAIRERACELCAPERGNPWLLGWFLDNELKWWGIADNGRKDLALFDTVAALPPEHSARKVLEKFVADFNAEAQRRGESSGCKGHKENPVDLVNPIENNSAFSATPRLFVENTGEEVRAAFLRHFAERYFSVLCSAIREADPDHMILGCRFAGPFSQVHPVLWEVCGKYCDIVSFNCYPWADIDQGIVLDGKGGRPVAELFAEIHGWAGKPLLVTEWSFPALDTGRPCLYGAGQRFRTQAERARAAEFFARLLSSLPFMAGHVFFMFLDQPASGISETFREDSNYGLINEFGVPYPELTAALRSANRKAAALHAEGTISRGDAENADFSATKGRKDNLTSIPQSQQSKSEPSRTSREEKTCASAFLRENNRDWCLTNAFVRLSGATGDGPAVGEISFLDSRLLGGVNTAAGTAAFQTVGSLVVCLEWKGPSGSVWTKATRVTAIESDSVAVILRCEGEEDGTRFAMPLRFTLADGGDFFTAEILGVENTGDRPVEISAVFLMPMPAESNPVPVPVVPNLWDAPAEGWWRLPDGGAWGAVSHDDAATFRFWVREGDGSVHPDARFRVGVDPVSVVPGETWCPVVPFSAQIARKHGKSPYFD